jgi:hypothetical protein
LGIRRGYDENILVYVLFSCFVIYMSRPWYLGAIVGLLFIGSQLFSVFFVKNFAWKSWWCWKVNFIPIIYIIISYIIHKN